jgi:hypothetical protein
VAWPDGHDAVRRAVTGAADRAEALGQTIADQLATAGAAEILSAVRNGVTP